MARDSRVAFIWLLASPFIAFGLWYLYLATWGWDDYKPQTYHNDGVRFVETKSSRDRLWKGLTGAGALAVGVGGSIYELRKLRSRQTLFPTRRRGPMDASVSLHPKRRIEFVIEDETDRDEPPRPPA